MSRTRVVSERPALPRGVGAGDAGRGWRQPLIVLGVLATLVAGLGVPAARAQEPPPERQAILDQLTQINQQLAQAQDLLQGQPSQDAIRQAHDLIAKAGDASWSLLRQPPLSTESIFGIALGAWVQFFDALDTDLGDAHGHLLDADWDLRQGRESAAADDAAYARGHLLDARSGLNAMLNTAGLEDDGRAALLQIRDQIDAIIGTLDSDSPTLESITSAHAALDAIDYKPFWDSGHGAFETKTVLGVSLAHWGWYITAIDSWLNDAYYDLGGALPASLAMRALVQSQARIASIHRWRRPGPS